MARHIGSSSHAARTGRRRIPHRSPGHLALIAAAALSVYATLHVLRFAITHFFAPQQSSWKVLGRERQTSELIVLTDSTLAPRVAHAVPLLPHENHRTVFHYPGLHPYWHLQWIGALDLKSHFPAALRFVVYFDPSARSVALQDLGFFHHAPPWAKRAIVSGVRELTAPESEAGSLWTLFALLQSDTLYGESSITQKLDPDTAVRDLLNRIRVQGLRAEPIAATAETRL